MKKSGQIEQTTKNSRQPEVATPVAEPFQLPEQTLITNVPRPALDPATWHNLQRTIGNQRVARLIQRRSPGKKSSGIQQFQSGMHSQLKQPGTIVTIYFKTGSTALDAGDKRILNQFDKELHKLSVDFLLNGGPRIDIIGQADYRGGGKENEALSEQRAAAVKDYLIKKPTLRRVPHWVNALGFGERGPKNGSETSLGRYRRVDISIRWPTAASKETEKVEPEPEKPAPLPDNTDKSASEFKHVTKEQTEGKKVAKLVGGIISTGRYTTLLIELAGGFVSASLTAGFAILAGGMVGVQGMIALGDAQKVNQSRDAVIGAAYGTVAAAMAADPMKPTIPSPPKSVDSSIYKKAAEAQTKDFTRRYKTQLAVMERPECKKALKTGVIPFIGLKRAEFNYALEFFSSVHQIRKNPEKALNSIYQQGLKTHLGKTTFVAYKQFSYSYLTWPSASVTEPPPDDKSKKKK